MDSGSNPENRYTGIWATSIATSTSVSYFSLNFSFKSPAWQIELNFFSTFFQTFHSGNGSAPLKMSVLLAVVILCLSTIFLN